MGSISGKPLHRFTSEEQPEKRGRPKNIFGPLAKANDLTNDDVKKIFKNLLTSRPEEINQVIEKYPTVLTIATANILAQEMKGELTGRYEAVLDKEGNQKFDKEGKPIMRQERKRSYDMVKYMIDRCFGKPIQTDVVIGSGVSERTEILIAQIFNNVAEESNCIEPLIIEPQIEYTENDEL